MNMNFKFATLLAGFALASGVSAGEGINIFDEMDGRVGLNANVVRADGDTSEDNLALLQSYIRVGKYLNEGPENRIKLVLKAELNDQLRYNGVNVTKTFDMEEFWKEVYIKWENVFGTPVAVVVGKHEMAWGQNEGQNQMLNREFNPLDSLLRIDQVTGFTIALTPQAITAMQSLGIFNPDSIEFSAFSNHKYGITDSEIDSISARIRKTLSSYAQLTVSYANLGDKNLSDPTDVKGDGFSVGIILKHLGWTFWGEVLAGLDISEKANLGFTGGASTEVCNTTLAFEVTGIEHELVQLAAGWKIPVASPDGTTVTFGPEIRYTDYSSDATMGSDDSVQGSIRMDVFFGDTRGASPNDSLDARGALK